MTYSFHYHIVSTSYNQKTQITRVEIINESTGELFFGTAHREPVEETNPNAPYIDVASRDVNLATICAVRKGIMRDLMDDKYITTECGYCMDFDIDN